MDMMPPQAPPPLRAGTSVAETANAAIGRLSDSRRWLEQQSSLMSEWTLPQDKTGMDTYLSSLAAHWAASDAGLGMSRTQALAHHLAQVMQNEATLRLADGTLDERSRTVIGALVAAHNGSPPEALRASEVTLGGIAYAGALIVNHTHVPGLTLLFMPDSGWQAFDGEDAAFAYLRQQLDITNDPLRARAMASDDLAQAMADGELGARDIASDIFDTLARRIIDAQRDKLAVAWDDYRLDTNGTLAATHLADRVRDHLRIGDLIDVDALLDLREARLANTIQQERMSQAPVQVQNAWRDALENFNEALLDTATLREAVGIVEPVSIHDHATRLLSDRLKTLGIDQDPNDIMVEIASLPDLGSPIDVAGTLIGGPAKRRVTLVELGYEGIGKHQLDSFRVVTSGDSVAPAPLTGQAIREILRDTDISTRYQAYLETTYRTGTRGAAARALAFHLQQARMRFEAEDARLGYYLIDEPKGFIFDREERGYQWIDAALKQRSATGRLAVNGHTIDVIQPTYKGVPMTDVLVFGSHTPQSAPRVVLYTPGAPDGLSFREFQDRQEAARKFFYHPAFREYLLDRLPAEFARVTGGRREFAGDTRAHWVLGAASDVAYTLTEEPFAEKVVSGDFIDAAYNASVELRKRNTRFVARSTADADRDAILQHPLGQLSFDPGARLAAILVAEIPASAVRAVQASWRFYDHVKAGDHGEAFVAFTEGYTSALNVITPGMLSPARRVPSIRPTTGSRTLIPANHPSTPTVPAFESRYVAQGVKKNKPIGADGFHHIGARRYVEQDGYLYAVRFDDDYLCWRLARPEGSLDAAFSGPAIERVNGQWRYARDVGLRGGMRRALRERFRRTMRVNDTPPPAAQAAAEVPAAPLVEEPHFYLPPDAEHLRAELTAAMRDNPLGHAMVRNDGRSFHIRPPAHTEVLFGEGLSPELAELSIHQRRTFLHELESRFPAPTDRATVIDGLGMARGGRRVPSPPRPGRAPQGDDGQVPDISSSSGDEASGVSSAPTVTAAQRARWDEALAVARETPRVSPRAPSPAASSSTQRTAPQPIPRDQWPERLWLYREHVPAYSTGGRLQMSISPLTSRRSPLVQNRFRVLSLPPGTRPDRLDDALGVPLEYRNAPGGSWHVWVEIDTRALREQQIAHGRPAYDLYPATQDQGGVRYSLRSWFHHLRLEPGTYRMGTRLD